MVPDSFIYVEKKNFLVSYMDVELNIINIIDDIPYQNNIEIEVQECVVYTQDEEYQKQFFNNENNREISFVPFVNFCSFIHYFI